MTEEELRRKTVLEQAVDRRITQKECAIRLNLSERRVRQLLSAYRKGGNIALVSGHRGKPSNHRMNEETHSAIVAALHAELYRGFGPTFLAETLADRDNIHVCKETLRKIMIEQGVHKPKIRKKKAHPERLRRPIRGELIQIDGSIHLWLENRGPKACLLVFVDDATSQILAAMFVEHESFFAYAELCKMYFSMVGVPLSFYSDKFSVFRVNSKYDGVTQFSRALSTLGIELICANSPQAKGRVERANQTLQDRLVKAMRLEGICDYQAANAFLPAFIEKYNASFAVNPFSMQEGHKPLDPSIDLDFVFSIHQSRLISKDLQIKYNHVTYQVVTDRPVYALAGRDVLMTEDSYGNVLAYLNNSKLDLKILERQTNQAKIVDGKTLSEKTYSPPVDHPWRSYGKKINGFPIVIQ